MAGEAPEGWRGSKRICISRGHLIAIDDAKVKLLGKFMEFAVEEVWNRKRRPDGIARQLRDEEKCTAERAKWTQIAASGKELVHLCSIYV